MPEELPMHSLIYAVSYKARCQPIDGIVGLDEFDMENVSALREHFRIPGMGLSTVRYFRDKLAMRMQACASGIPIPKFVPLFNDALIREFLESVPAPWLLKPRSEASSIGIHKLSKADEVWQKL